MSTSPFATEELRFEDLFDEDSQGDVNEEVPSPEATVAENSPNGEMDKGVSALTLTLRQLQNEASETDSMENQRAELELKWSRIHTQSHPVRMGSSAPVWIPKRSFTWTSQQYDRLHQIDEEGDGNIQRATTFVPPHLTVEQPVIQFSLNSGIAEKRAKLRAREKIFSMTGFCEKEDQIPAEASDFCPPMSGLSGLSREFGGTSSVALPRPSAA